MKVGFYRCLLGPNVVERFGLFCSCCIEENCFSVVVVVFFFFNYFLFSDKALNQNEIGRIQLMRCLTRLTNLKENETQFIPRGSHIKQTGILTGNFELTTFLKEANLGVAQAFCNPLKIPKKNKNIVTFSPFLHVQR